MNLLIIARKECYTAHIMVRSNLVRSLSPEKTTVYFLLLKLRFEREYLLSIFFISEGLILIAHHEAGGLDEEIIFFTSSAFAEEIIQNASEKGSIL